MKPTYEEMMDHLESREEDLDTLLCDDMYDEIYEYPLGVSKKTVYTIEISTGGPAEWLEVLVDEGRVVLVEFHYANWRSHEYTTVLESSSLFRMAELFLEGIE